MRELREEEEGREGIASLGMVRARVLEVREGKTTESDERAAMAGARKSPTRDAEDKVSRQE